MRYSTRYVRFYRESTDSAITLDLGRIVSYEAIPLVLDALEAEMGPDWELIWWSLMGDDEIEGWEIASDNQWWINWMPEVN